MAEVVKVIQDCVEQYASQEWELEELCTLILHQTLSLTQGQQGYVACGSLLEPDKMRYVASVNLDRYIKPKDVKLYRPNQTFFTPLHLRDRWLLIPLPFRSKLYGVLGVENGKGSSVTDLKSWLQPWAPGLVAVLLHNFFTTRDTLTQQDLFLSTVSHEIRTPLNGIVGMGRILKESQPLTEEQKSYLGVMNECTYQLLELMNDILDFSKMDCEQLPLVLETFDLPQCFEEIYDLVYLRVQEKRLTLQIHPLEHLPRQWKGDKKRLRQIVLNLVNNAIKYTDQGSIEVKVEMKDRGGPSDVSAVKSPTWLHVEVKDTGVGIPAAQRDHVFKSFHQVRMQRPNVEGVGLGLAICKKLCHLMGGEVYLHSSVVGQGTSVRFYLPLEVVLIADSQTSRRLELMGQALKWSLRPVGCSTQEEGLMYLTLQAPQMVWVEVSPWMAQLEQKVKDLGLPCVSLVSCVEGDALWSQVSRAWSQRGEATRKEDRGTPVPVSPGPVVATPALDILVVEDNPHNMTVVCEFLKKLGYPDHCIHKATNGADAIQKAIAKAYDVILMDLLLPMVDGVTAGMQIIQYYKSRCPKNLKFVMDKYESLVPTVVALTAMVTTETQSRCKQAGFKGFLTKPLNREELETMLTVIQRRRHQSRQNLLEVIQT